MIKNGINKIGPARYCNVQCYTGSYKSWFPFPTDCCQKNNVSHKILYSTIEMLPFVCVHVPGMVNLFEKKGVCYGSAGLSSGTMCGRISMDGSTTQILFSHEYCLSNLGKSGRASLCHLVWSRGDWYVQKAVVANFMGNVFLSYSTILTTANNILFVSYNFFRRLFG